MKRSKKIGVLAAAVVGLMFAAVAGATAANATDTEWVPDSYLEFIPQSCSQDGAEVRADAKFTIINNEAIEINTVDGQAVPEYLEYVNAGPGVHTFEYTVFNLAEFEETEYPPYAKSGTFTVEACPEEPEPQAPVVGADLHGILEDNVSSVHAVVTVDHGTAEGTLTVTLTGGGLNETLEFPEGTETLRATYPVDTCGAVTFTVGFAGQAGTAYVVNVPCPVTDGDGDGDGNSNGGSAGGGDSNGNTGGTTNPGTQPGTTAPVTTTPVSSGDYDTGDVFEEASSSIGIVAPLGYTVGGIAVVLAALLVAMGIIRSRRATVTN